MFAKVNSQVSVGDLIRGVAIDIGNDAALALAEGISGSEEAFVARMNAEAAQLGMTKSRFVNATGLPAPGQQITARDVVRLGRHLVAAGALYAILAEPEFVWNKIRQRNRNPLVSSYNGIPPYPGADGLMIGTSADYGHSLAGTAVRDGRRLFVVVAGLPDDEARTKAANALLDYGFNSFTDRELFPAAAQVAEASVFGGDAGRVSLLTSQAVSIPVLTAGQSKIEARVVYRGPLVAPLEKGATVAELKVWRDGLLQSEVPLVTGAAVARGPLWDRAVDAGYELAIGGLQAASQYVKTWHFTKMVLAGGS
jgi:D-alanyl-D-alanine carboxypeptidase (penicillin-binding protein 5/6)